MYSLVIPASSVFCDWFFLVFSGVSLETAPNYLLFFDVAMIRREKLCQLWRLNSFFYFVTKVSISSITRGKGFNKSKQSLISKNECNTKRPQTFRLMIVLSSLLFIPFFLGGKKTVCIPIQGTNGESILITLFIKRKRQLWR